MISKQIYWECCELVDLSTSYKRSCSTAHSSFWERVQALLLTHEAWKSTLWFSSALLQALCGTFGGVSVWDEMGNCISNKCRSLKYFKCTRFHLKPSLILERFVSVLKLRSESFLKPLKLSQRQNNSVFLLKRELHYEVKLLCLMCL